jgi:hypothetical protein
VDFFRHSLEGFPVCWGIGSAEGLQKRLAQGNRLLLCFDEVKQFISKCKIEGSVLLPCVNTLFESNHYENRTKTTDIYLEKVYLAMLGASTVATYENTWSSQFTDIGFGNRLFLVPGSGERRFSLPAKIPEPERNHLKQRLGQILRHVAERLEFSLTRPAWEVYDQWYLGLEKSVHIRRLDTYALRLMPLLAINELKSEVDEDIVRKVIALCDWQYRVRKLHDPIDADGKLAHMEQRIRQQLANRGNLTERELKKFTNAYKAGLSCYDSAKRNLEKAGELKFDPKTRRWFLRREP